MNGPLEGRERTEMRVAAHLALVKVQVDACSVAEEIDHLIGEGERRGWPEVAVVALYARDFAIYFGGDAPDEGALDHMWHLAEAAEDPALVALALAFRSRVRSATGDLDQVVLADTDLATAVVMLERREGGSLERKLAHVECGIAFGFRHFWELERAQYAAAQAIDPAGEEAALASHADVSRFSQWAPAYNLVELETRWACAHRIAGDPTEQRAHAAEARRKLADAEASQLPEEWQRDLAVTVLLARALEGEDVAAEAEELARIPGLPTEVVGTALTARAVTLAEVSPGEAAVVAEMAIRLLSEVADPTAVDLAMWIAAETEKSPAGLRFGRIQAERRWTERRLRYNAMEATLRSERFRARSEELERHAHLDPLTGLANRRGFSRYLDGLLASPAPRIALLAVDIDRFKRVNDTHGHSAGDEVLIRLGGILGSLVRHSDLAARLGGDEFMVILNGTGIEIAVERATSVLRAVALPAVRDGEEGVAFNVSIGVATGDPNDLDLLMADADRALYDAKSTGGGRVVAARPRIPSPPA